VKQRLLKTISFQNYKKSSDLFRQIKFDEVTNEIWQRPQENYFDAGYKAGLRDGVKLCKKLGLMD